MSDETININPDPLAEFENILRTTGAWCDIAGEYEISHYFVARNKKIDTAISLCGERVTVLKNLRRTIPRKKCLACELLKVSRLEVRKSQIENRDDPQK